jgi:hypothetical protein
MSNDSLKIIVCPFCFEYKMMFQEPMSASGQIAFENHIDKCPVRRKNRINDAISKTLDENNDLLIQLGDSNDE